MSITAIVPVWNGRELLRSLLDTLDAQTLRAAETIVVDNGSSDGAPDFARSRGARVIAMGRNAGFAAAVNRGIAAAQSDWVAVLNTDVELAPDYFERLAGTPDWFATGKILDARRNGTVDGAFDLTCRGATTWRAGSGRPDGPEWSKERRITSPPWTAVLFRRGLFDKVGVLEERFESYLEDVDFGLRCAARRVAGRYVPEAIAWHVGSAALGRWHPQTVRRIARNQVWLAARHLPPECRSNAIIAQALWGCVALRRLRGWSWMRGVVEGLASFRRMRMYDPELLDHLTQNERTIAELQSIGGFDSYWKWYFRFAGTGAK